MKTIADQLPPEIARQLHPDRRKNEAEYWAARDQLLGHYKGQWIGFANAKVIASGASPVEVFHTAEATGLHPFFICVGREEEPCRIRRAAFAYDDSYSGEALPVIAVEFRKASGAPGVALDEVIPDTGADASVLPWADCQTLALDPSLGTQGLMSGVAGSSAGNLGVSDVGPTRRTGLPLPTPGGLRRERTNTWPRRPQSVGCSVSRSKQ